MIVAVGEHSITAADVVPMAPLARWNSRVVSILLPLALTALGCQVVAMYGRSITLGLMSDDWFLLATSRQLPDALGFDGTYHFNPITKLLIYLSYQLFGMHVIGYHVVALGLFWLAAVLVMMVARHLTGSLAVGAVAAIVYVAYGTQYEAAIWGVVAYYQTLGTVFSLTGMLLYLHALDQSLTHRHRSLTRLGFIAVVILSPFVYEQSIVLIFTCMLYRLVVIERGIGWTQAALADRMKVWLEEFAIPIVFLLFYIGLKLALAGHTSTPQLPGLSQSLTLPMYFLCLGIFWAFLPALSVNGANWLALGWWSVIGFLYILVAQCAILLFFARALRPLYRFLVLWTCLLVTSLVFGLGAIGSRHLLLITVPTAILWACALSGLVRRAELIMMRLAIPRHMSMRLRWIPSTGLVLLILLAGYTYTQSQVQAWAATSDRVGELVGQIGQFADAFPSADTIYLVNLPDSDVAPTGETTYLFRNATPVLMSLAYPNRFKRSISVRTKDYAFAHYYSIFATGDQLTNWARQPRTLVLVYDESSGTIQRWPPSVTP